MPSNSQARSLPNEGRYDSSAPATGDFVYVIDDEQAVRDSTCFLISSLGIGCARFAGGAEFLEAISGLAAGCILIDVKMSGMSGHEVQAELTRRGLAWPVIFMSGTDDVAAVVAAIRDGALDFLEKPFSEETVLAALHRGFVSMRSDKATISPR